MITLIIECRLSDNQLSSRKGSGTKDAIFQFQTISERVIQFNKKIYACFILSHKAFDQINHEKLIKIFEKAEITLLKQKIN